MQRNPSTLQKIINPRYAGYSAIKNKAKLQASRRPANISYVPTKNINRTVNFQERANEKGKLIKKFR